MKKLVAYSIILLIAACGASNTSLDAILGAQNEHFQGVSIGDKHEKVSKKTAAQAITNNEVGIVCSYAFEEVEVTATYEFDGEKLYSIQADLFFPDTSALNNFEEGLIARYNNSYGEMTENGGFFVWQENNEVEFTLADESIEFGQPKLSLTIYNFGY